MSTQTAEKADGAKAALLCFLFVALMIGGLLIGNLR